MTNNKRIVICGSMSFYDEMLSCQEIFHKNNIPSIVPKEEGQIIQSLTVEQFNEFKRNVSNQYLRKIREKDVFGILVVNQEKRGIKNYIGANTFAEIAMAFCWNRKIFLLHDIYDNLADELKAWNATPLRGDINKLIELYNLNCLDKKHGKEQLSMFNWKKK